MATSDAGGRNAGGNWKSLGMLWVVYAILRLAAVILLLLYWGTATVMFGALLSRAPDPFTLMNLFHVVYIGVIVVGALSGLFGLFAGLALLSGGGSARSLSLAASFFSLCDIPLGTTLGIYTMIVFLR